MGAGTGGATMQQDAAAEPVCREEVKAVPTVPSRDFAEEAKIEGEKTT